MNNQSKIVYEPGCDQTPIQIGVAILRDLINGSIGEHNIEEACTRMQEAQLAFAKRELVDNGWDRNLLKQLLDVELHETMEDTPIYDAYYSFMSRFERKVFQAAASAS